MVQLASVLPIRVLTEAKILRSKIEIEKKATNLKILKLQEYLRQCHYSIKILKNEVRKRDQKYDLLLNDFKKLGLEGEKLKGGQKAKYSLKENQDWGRPKDQRTPKIEESFEKASPSS